MFAQDVISWEIIKEEGKELKAFEVPDEIYNSDPDLWNTVIDGMANPAPGEKAGWFKLRTQRNKLSGWLKWIVKRNKEIKKMEADLNKSFAIFSQQQPIGWRVICIASSNKKGG